MRRIEITPGIHSSVLGLGCAPVLGAVDRKRAATAVATALEGGINHFDLARSYGYGKAEGFVGRQLRGKRDRVVIATKFGIQANWKAGVLSPLKPFLRSLRAAATRRGGQEGAKAAPAGARMAGRLLDRLPITAGLMQQSLEASLRALATDYIDILFVHEPHQRIERWEEVIALGDRLKQAGKIRALGLAYMGHQRGLHATYVNHFDVTQTNVPTAQDDYAAMLGEGVDPPDLLFSPMQAPFPGLAPGERLGKVMADFPRSVTLCAMFNPLHLQSNIRIAAALSTST